MTTNETFVLMIVLQADPRPTTYREVAQATRKEPWAILNGLKEQGAISHPCYGHWSITEKGRIAAALARAKDPKLAKAFPVELTP